jgi:VanZ family protein
LAFRVKSSAAPGRQPPPVGNGKTSRQWGLVRWVAVVLWLVVIVLMTHTPPDSPLMRRLPHYAYGDKLVHTGLYGLLGWLLWYRRQARGWEFLLGLLLAAGDELTQPWVGRLAELGDWLADAFGLTAGLGLASLQFRWRQHVEELRFPPCGNDVRDTASAGDQGAGAIGCIGERSEQSRHGGNHTSTRQIGCVGEQLEGTDLQGKDWPGRRGSP